MRDDILSGERLCKIYSYYISSDAVIFSAWVQENALVQIVGYSCLDRKVVLPL